MNKTLFEEKLSERRILMRLPVRARLKISIVELRNLLRKYPGLRQFSHGKRASYYFDATNELIVFHFLEDSIIYEIYSSSSPVYLLREALLRLFGVVIFLQDAYDLFPESIFPYVVSELSKQEINSIPKKVVGAKINSETILSKRIITLLDDVESLTTENTELKSRFSLLAAQLLIKESESGLISISEVSKKYSLKQDVFDSAKNLLGRFGYRAIHQGPDRLKLVNL